MNFDYSSMELEPKPNGNIQDSWTSLRSLTSARIALGRSGSSVPLSESLNFKLAHANARDAVYSTLDFNALTTSLTTFNLPLFNLHSRVFFRQEYLQRPDLGRRLNEVSVEQLKSSPDKNCDVAIILADGLSATAINRHAEGVLSLLIPQLRSSGISIAPLTMVEHGRVAISDEIGELLNVRVALILIGERPGLSAYVSMGAYLTYGPRIGLTDESRNCVANIRPEGLHYPIAVEKILYLIKSSLQLKLSGVKLKDNYTQII